MSEEGAGVPGQAGGDEIARAPSVPDGAATGAARPSPEVRDSSRG
jgi:hypothetical protein